MRLLDRLLALVDPKADPGADDRVSSKWRAAQRRLDLRDTSATEGVVWSWPVQKASNADGPRNRKRLRVQP
ncbi:MAG: hypothetical protein ABIF82_00735 [Planctomycetota bacterium]